MTSKNREALFSNPLFAAMRQSDCENLIKTGRAKTVAFEKGDAVMTEENFVRCLIVILKGNAAVYKTGGDGRRTVINLLHRGDVFGMATLFFYLFIGCF